MNKTLKSILQFLIFFGVGFSILFFLYKRNNAAYQDQCKLDGIPLDECSLFEKIVTDFQEADFFWLGMVIVVYLLSNVSRALRWKMLLKPLGYNIKFWNSFHATMLGYFANLGFPRLGEVLRPGVITRYEGVPMEKAFGTIVTDRILDFLALFVVIGIALISEYKALFEWLETNANLTEKIEGLLNSPILKIGIVAILLGLGLLFFFRKKIMETALFEKVKNIALGFWEGISSISKVDNIWMVGFHTFFIWLMYFSMTWLCMLAFQPTAGISPMQGLMVFVFGALGMVVPAPGGMGSYHAAITAGLVIYGIPEVEGFSFANILFFTIQLFGNVLLGIIALIALPLINKSDERGGAETQRN